jgi:hypothetical protein
MFQAILPVPSVMTRAKNSVLSRIFAATSPRYLSPVRQPAWPTSFAHVSWPELHGRLPPHQTVVAAAEPGTIVAAAADRDEERGDDIAPMARDAVAIRRLIDPNPRDVTEADVARVYRAVRHTVRFGYFAV